MPSRIKQLLRAAKIRTIQTAPWIRPIARAILRRPPLPGEAATLSERIFAGTADPYQAYIAAESAVREQNRDHYKLRMADFTSPPLFSILLPTYNTPIEFLKRALDSVAKQIYPHWELCIVDDASPNSAVRDFLTAWAATHPNTRLHFRKTNGGISAATNDALNLAKGDFVAFLDHDDELTEDALYFLADRLNDKPQTDLLYTDQDKISEKQLRYEPFFKPDWSLEYLRGVMYTGHLVAVRRTLALEVGGCDSAFNGVQDFDFTLRIAEKTTRVEHIQRICYHWRAITGSVATSLGAKPQVGQLQQKAVQAHLARLNLPATAASLDETHRLRIHPQSLADGPLVSILICTRDAAELITRCLDSLFEKTHYRNFEVIIADNDTTDPAALAALEKHPIRKIPMPGTFHFAAFNNRLAEQAKGEYLLFLNNDTEFTDPAWLDQLLFYARMADTGAIGPLLVFPDGSVQHAGVILGPRGTADHVMRNFPADCDGYFGSLRCTREVSAVTAACMMVKRELFQSVGGFNELFRNHYEDVDLNLRFRTRGLRNIYVGAASVIHHESKTRGKNYDYNDRILLLDQWEEAIDKGDPYYNRNFSAEHFDYTISTRALET